jgi:Abortive infection alpha
LPIIPDDITAKVASGAEQVLPELYRDTLQPAAKEVGTALGRAIRIALAPIRGLAWTWERAEAWLEDTVEQRLSNRRIEPERVVSPPPQIAAGIIRGVQAAGPEVDETLREMFASLLATAMNADSVVRAHPAFAEILSQITADEARLLRVLASRTPSPIVRNISVNHVEGFIPQPIDTLYSYSPVPDEVGVRDDDVLVQSYLDNLQRLGLIKLASESFEAGHASKREGEDKKYIAEQQVRWRLVRQYLLSYGSPGITKAVELFECVESEAPPPEKKLIPHTENRPSIFIDGIWATSFGAQLLRACSEPDAFGSMGTSTLESENIGEASPLAT